MRLYPIAIIGFMLLGGCTTTHLEGPGGFLLDRTSILQNIYAKVTLPDGTIIEYANDGGIIAAKAAAEAAINAAALLGKEPPKVK